MEAILDEILEMSKYRHDLCIYAPARAFYHIT